MILKAETIIKISLNIFLNISKSHTISHHYRSQLTFCNWISENFIRRQCNISYKMIIYFINRVTMYCFVRLWINQKNEIKLYKFCTINSVIKTRIWCLSKYHNVIDERKCIKMLKNMCFHVINISCEQINNKMRSYILFEYQSCEKK